MSLDRNKVLEAAQKYLAKGQYDKAIAEFQKILQADPKDVRTLLKIGDLHTKRGAVREACDAYLKVAEAYGQQGFHLKSVAVYKQVLKLDPSRIDVYLKLASTYETLELTNDALQTYEQVASYHTQKNEPDKALATFERMTTLDPQNLPVRIRYAEALSKANRTADAAREFERGATLLKQQGRMDDYLKVAERLLFHRPDDVALARELAQLYVERNDGKRALAKLQVCFKANPKDTVVLDLLARAFLTLDQKPKAVSVYREIAKHHGDAQRHDERARALKRILELEPGDAEARQALAGYAPSAKREAPAEAVVPSSAVVGGARAEAPKAGATAPRPAGAAPAIKPPTAIPPRPPASSPSIEPSAYDSRSAHTPEPESEEEVLLVADEEDESSAGPAPVAPASTATESVSAQRPSAPDDKPADVAPPADVTVDAQVARLLTECDVFARYGLKQKILDQLERVVVLAPTHVEARERLKESYLEAGRVDDAIEQLLALAALFRTERPQLAHLYLKQILLLDPENPEARSMMRPGAVPAPAPRATPIPAAPTPAPVAAVSAKQPVPDVEEEEEILEIDEDLELEADASEAHEPPTRGDAGATELAPERTAQTAAPDEEDEGVLFVDDDAGAAEPAEDADSAESADSGEISGPVPSIAPHADEPVETIADAARLSRPPSIEDSQATRLPTARARPSAAPGDDGNSGLLTPMTPEEFEAVPVSSAGEARASVPSSVGIEEILEEADFYVAQGLFEEARETLDDALAAHPGHRLLFDKLEEVAEAEAAAGTTAASMAPPPSETADDDAAFALAEKLAEELGPEETAPTNDILDVDEVFAQFKKGVEAQIDASDSETHYDLGIAYKEMGLLDDAVHEFELAMANPRKECLAATMIGLCHLEKNDAATAIRFFDRALAAPQTDPREKLGIWFELGSAHALLGDNATALSFFGRVQVIEPQFRNVGERIRALTPAPTETSAADQDELDKAFDELLGD